MPNSSKDQDRPHDGGALPLEYHPCANLFPLMEGQPFDDLKADIKEHGLNEPIVIHDGKILDGRNRDRACTEAGVEPSYVPFRGDDPLAFVLSANLHRRHLDVSQRAMIAAKLANMRQGERTDPKHATLQVSRKTAATSLHVSERTVASAAVVRDQGAPELIAAVEAGDIPVSTAADLAREPIEAQREFIENLPRDDDGKLTPEAKKAAKASTEPGDAAPKRSKQHQAALFDIKRDNANDIAAAIVGNMAECKARKIAEAIVARLDARKNKTGRNSENIEV